MIHTVSDDWCETTCKPGVVQGAGCASMCCCDTSCDDEVTKKRIKDKELFLKESEADFTGTPEQCHFPQCSKDICPVDECQLTWTSACKGPRPVVYMADGHSGSSIITAALANLTGSFVNPWAPYWPELFGDTVNKARTLRTPVKFMSQFFCNGRRMYPLSKLVGFKWKTYGGRYEETPQYDETWQYIAERKIPVVWVLRNTLDIIVSDTVHYEQTRDPAVQSAFGRRAEYQLGDATRYFLDAVERVGAADFIPSTEDVLHARVRTSGVVAKEFGFRSLKFQVFDVGGQRCERRKWIQYFDHVTALVFVAAISEYNQVMAEDSSKNRLQEALDLFEQIANSHHFTDATIMLFLNKKDLFEEKIVTVDPGKWFPKYTGGCDAKAAEAYFTQEFLSRVHDKRRTVYSYTTCATNSNNVQVVFDAVTTILQEGMADGLLMQ